MKIYAKVESERATKGQGGEWLDIELSDDLRKVFATIKIREKETGTGHTIEILHNSLNTKVIEIDETKGKKQKGEVLTEEGKRHVQNFGEQHPLFHSAEMREYRKNK